MTRENSQRGGPPYLPLPECKQRPDAKHLAATHLPNTGMISIQFPAQRFSSAILDTLSLEANLRRDVIAGICTAK